ncbi:MAG TPA: DUF6496 domain-containing protein, partial [Rhodopila sp.]|nr:DUF6496 domain-containing protein [Rhodopila sp.]
MTAMPMSALGGIPAKAAPLERLRVALRAILPIAGSRRRHLQARNARGTTSRQLTGKGYAAWRSWAHKPLRGSYVGVPRRNGVRPQIPGGTAKVNKMARQNPEQKKIVGRVMHEFKHGELKRGRGGKVKNPRQAIAIALSEAGASNQQSPAENRRNLKRTETRQRRG